MDICKKNYLLKSLSRDEGGLIVIETAYNGFEMDWVLKNDFIVCNYEMKCPADAYAIYNLQGDLVGTRTESLKLEFDDTKYSFRQFSKFLLYYKFN